MKNSIPTFMYGTAWKEERTADLTEMALHAGFRAIDTANQRKHYFEEGVGVGLHRFLKSSGVTRDQIFLQTKFTYARGQDHRKPYDDSAPYSKQVEQSFASSLDHLGVTTIDSLVLHGPYSSQGLSKEDQEVWRAMEAIHASGQVRHLGVSNVSCEQLRELFQFATVKPKFAQIRTYASRAWERDTREFCKANEILFQGFSLLTANSKVMTSQLVLGLAVKYRREPSQIVFRFARHLGMIPLTGTSSAAHMKTDLAIDDFALTREEVEAIEQASV